MSQFFNCQDVVIKVGLQFVLRNTIYGLRNLRSAL